jgi:hypothetical protein
VKHLPSLSCVAGKGGLWVKIIRKPREGLYGRYMDTKEYYKAVADELREHLEYRKRKPLLWLTSREISDIIANNRHWKVNEATLMSIYKEIKTKVTQINSSHQQTSTEDRT